MDKITGYFEEFKTRIRKASFTNSDYDKNNSSSTETGVMNFKLLRRFSSGEMNYENP